MTKRIITATTAIVLGALAAAPAYARSSDHSMRASAYERYADDDDDEDRPRIRHTRRHAAAHRQRRAEGRPARRQRQTRHAHGGGAGTSRSCLRPAARALLGRIESTFGSVQIVSTCRPGAVIAGSGRPSKHASGEAIDFNAPRGRKAELVRWLIANHKRGGTMTYAGMSHIHVDVGYHFVSLNSHSGG